MNSIAIQKEQCCLNDGIQIGSGATLGRKRLFESV